MNVSIRNGIVLENILPLVEDVVCAVRLSAVCKRWYEQINNDTVLWKRLLQLEQIEDPEYWYRADDNNDIWTLGTPCKPKNILLNYRRTYYCIKHKIYKKYEFKCDDNYVFKYDGNILLFTRNKALHIYKVINNNLELFQKIDLSIYGIGDLNINEEYDYGNDQLISVYTNKEFIVIILYIDAHNMIAYRLEGNKYVVYKRRRFEQFRNCCFFDTARVLDSHVLAGTYFHYYDETRWTVAWRIPENKVIFYAYNCEFEKYENGIVFIFDRKEEQLVLYNEDFKVIYRINQTFERISDVLINDEVLHVVYRNDGVPPSISTWDKATGKINIRSKNILAGLDYLAYYQFFLVNNNIIAASHSRIEPFIGAYDAMLRELWSYRLPERLYSYGRYYCIFNKLLVTRNNDDTEESSIEFRNINNGKVVFTTELFKNCWSFCRDILIYGEPTQRRKTVLLYR